MKLIKKNISSVAQPFGPYSHVAVTEGEGLRTAYLSGMTGRDERGDIIAPGQFEHQIEQVFKNISNVLTGLGMEMNDVCRMTLYTTRIEEYEAVRMAKERWFTAPFPASTMIGVSSLNNPMLTIEIEIIAARSAT